MPLADLGTDLGIALRNLLQHRKRNLFLGTAIAAVTALLVVLGAFTEGIRGAMLESASTLMTGHVNVGGFFKFTSGSSAPLVSDYPRVLEEVRRHVPELELVTARVRGYAKAVSERSSMDVVLAGIDVAAEPTFRRNVKVREGSVEALARPGTVLLFEDQARRLEVKVGDVVTLSAPTSRGVNNTVDVQVVAVARNLGLLSSFSAFLSADTLRGLYNMNDRTTGALHLYLEDAAAAGAVAARLRGALASAGWEVMEADPKPYWEKLFAKVNAEDWTGQKLDVTTWSDELTFLSWILSGINAITGVLLFILLVIVVIGILNTLAIAIRERTREIGTLRAIGMQRARVLRLFLAEAALLGLAGVVGGALLGVVIAVALDRLHLAVPEAMQLFLMQQHLTLRVGAGPVAVRAGFIFLVTALAALAPALRAARLRPVTAMHHIG